MIGCSSISTFFLS